RKLLRRSMGTITEAQNSDHALVLIDDRQAADLMLLHDPDRIINFFAIAAINDAARHDVASRHSRTLHALRDAAADDVTISNHSNQPIILPDGERTNVLVTHELGDLDDRCAGLYPVHAWVHGVFHFHHGNPLPCPMQSRMSGSTAYATFKKGCGSPAT